MSKKRKHKDHNNGAEFLCAICGEPVTEEQKCNLDHIIPQSIYKWTGDRESKKIITSGHNQALVHAKCNMEKNDAFPNIRDLYISKGQKEILNNLIEKIKPAIISWKNIKRQLGRKQEGRCFCCGKELKDIRVLRRINPDKPRTWDNACLVCPSCNKHKKDFISCGG